MAPLVMRGAVAVAAAISMSNVSPALLPAGLGAAQQYGTLAAWLAFIAASYRVAPVERLRAGTEAIALALFYAYACWSVTWADLSVSSLMKAVALAITGVAAFRVAAALSIDEVVRATSAGFTAVCAASLAIVLFVPGIGLDTAWSHEGYWQGIFESKQALGSVSALLIVLAFHRWREGGGTARFAAILALAGLCNVMSGSRDAGGLALLGCLGLAAAKRWPAVTRALCMAPAVMTLAAGSLLGFLWSTGQPFIPVLGVKVDLTERVVIWAYALSHFDARPVIGYGLDGFWSDPDILHAFDRQHGWVLDNYHDGYLAVLVETGIVGLVLFGAAAFLFGLKAQWLGRHGRMDQGRHRLMVVFVGLAFFANFTETFFLRSTNYVAVLGLVFMALVCRAGDGARRPTREPREALSTWPRARRRTLAAAALALAAAGTPASAAPAEPEPAFAVAARLGRGVNLLGYDGIWDGHADAPFRLSQFRTIRAAGFGHVRINLFGFRHMDADGRLDETFLAVLDTVLDAATAAGLIPVIDEHDNQACQADPEGCAVRLKRFWSQLAARYAGRRPDVVFEVLNEPGGAMTWASWNRLAGEALAVIRASNPGRTVVVATLNESEAQDIARLVLPEADRDIIVTVHYYKPLDFTHQGAPWSPEFSALHGVAWGGEADRAAVTADFDRIAAWSAAHRRPVYLGEFGVYDSVPMAGRAAYDGFVARTAERHAWPWAYWQFDHDFAVYDQARRRWIRPILDALVSGAGGAQR